MPKSRKNQIKQCDLLIETAGDLIDDKKYRETTDALLEIEEENRTLINSDRDLTMGLNSYLGLAYYHRDKLEGKDTNYFLEKGVEHFSIALDIKEASENILFMRAKCYDYLGMAKEAEADYRRVIELNPKADCAHAFLGLLMENEGYWNEAVKLYREALRQDPTYEVIRERMENLIRNLQKRRSIDVE
jgi:tetratricopeptide (TPR) repeat protein